MPRQTQPHLLILMSDQHSSRFLGCGEDPFVRTPALDRLAANGVLFENAYCPFPLCVPSRMSMLTARYCHNIGVWGNSDSLGSNIPTFAHGLGIVGYRTVLAGRMHFIGEDQRHGFQERLLGDVSSPYLGRNRAEYRHRGFWGINEAVANSGPGFSHDLYYDQAVAMEACRLIRDHAESQDPRPPCLMVSFYSPHDPYKIFAKYYDLYNASQDLPFHHNRDHTHPAYQRAADHFRDISEDQIRQARASYRGKTSFVDDLIGTVMECWSGTAMANNSVYAYCSDHGDMMGEHGLWGKGSLFDGSARVPLIISAPGLVPSGQKIRNAVGLIDLMPTILELANAEPLPRADGRSLLPALQGDSNAWPEYVLAESCQRGAGPARMVRQGPWKLNVYAETEVELFNLDDDPQESTNLAMDTENLGIVRNLEKLAYVDGWSVEKVNQSQSARQADYQYLSKWTQAVEPNDPVMWGIPAPL